ncbi:unnamed protein product [Clavelina lepadiformis]|uniref:Uncharacterized protein n=1 Tax=Clavelina lepadiformis TaxID=159417 RepID=A0ABP0G6U5_CLALP
MVKMTQKPIRPLVSRGPALPVYTSTEFNSAIINPAPIQRPSHQAGTLNHKTVLSATHAAYANTYFTPIRPQPAAQTRQPCYQPISLIPCTTPSTGENVSFTPVIRSPHQLTNTLVKSCSSPTLRTVVVPRIPSTSPKPAPTLIESMQETIQRQRVLIGKLISVIVNEKLKTQATPPTRSEKEAALYEDVEKLLKFTDKQNIPNKKGDHENITDNWHLNGPKHSPVSERKKRTRTITNDKKVMPKRLRQKSPKFRTADWASTSGSSVHESSVKKTHFVLTRIARSLPVLLEAVKRWVFSFIFGLFLFHETRKISPLPKLQPKDATKLDSSLTSEESKQGVDSESDFSEIRQRTLGLMRPDGDSCLFSLRLEFSHQLKSLEKTFKKAQQVKSPAAICSGDVPELQPRRDASTANISSDDSDWKPATSSGCDTSSESPEWRSPCRMKENRKRKNLPWWTAGLKRFRGRRQCRSRRLAARQASYLAMHKIDEIYDQDATSPSSCKTSGLGRKKCSFNRRALQLIRRARRLWTEMTLKTSAFHFSEKMIEYRNRQDMCCDEVPESRIGTNANESKEHHFGKIDDEKDDYLRNKISVNKSDPLYMISRFLNVAHHQPGNDSEKGVKDHAIETECAKADQPNAETKAEECNKSSKSTSDIFKSDDGLNCCRNQNLSFISTLPDLIICEPEDIGEVVVVEGSETSSNYCNDSLEKKLDETISSVDKASDSSEDQHHLEVVKDANRKVIAETESLSGSENADRKSGEPGRIASILISQVCSLVTPKGDSSPVQKSEPLSRKNIKPESSGITSASETDSCHQTTSDANHLHHDFRIGKNVKTGPTFGKLNDSQGKLGESMTLSDSDSDATNEEKSARDHEREQERKSILYCDIMATNLTRKKNLMSKISKQNIENDTPVLEWGLHPRRAMCRAKAKIQVQLSNLTRADADKDNDEDTPPLPNRRASLRNQTRLKIDCKTSPQKVSRQYKETMISSAEKLGSRNVRFTLWSFVTFCITWPLKLGCIFFFPNALQLYVA